MDALKEWINNSLKEITNDAFRDVVKVDLDVKPMDDGQVVIISDINRVRLHLTTANGEKRSLDAVAKLEPTSETGKALALQCNVFQTEMNMYNHILKSMEKLMLEVDDTELLWPECYHCSDNKFLFKDLCVDDYRVVPTYNFLDRDHVLLVMRGLGQLHGLSMVLNHRQILDKDKLSVCMLERKLPFVANIHKTYMTNLSNQIREKWSPEWSSAADGLLKLVSDPSETMFEMCQEANKKWLVMCHGDFTMRNMLFHYPKGSQKPDKLNFRFVDFQMCNWSNLGLDLASFLYSSIMPQERDKLMDENLTAYVESLSSTCRSLNFTGPCPTVEDVKQCLKQLSYLTSVSSLCGIPIFMASKNEDVQGKSEELMEAIVSPEFTDETKDDTFFKDVNLIPVMQYEIKRFIDEKIIDA